VNEETTIKVDFRRPMPLFPLDSVVLLPHQIQPLHIFEPRYKQMVSHALDGPGQIAMGVFEGDRWKTEYHGNPPVRPAVCVGQIVQHDRLPSGEYNVLLQGVCRARIADESLPDGQRLYREVALQAVATEANPPELPGVRDRLEQLFSETSLNRLSASEWLLERVRNEEIPVAALLELVSFTVLSDRDVRYTLLAEPDARRRADIIDAQLEGLDRLLRRAEQQHPEEWPKGCSWN